jgi:hypothetical protein
MQRVYGRIEESVRRELARTTLADVLEDVLAVR